MKLKTTLFLTLLVAAVTMTSSCTFRLVDFTVISSKNVNLGIDRKGGKKVEGSKTYFLGIGWNIKDAMDEALESAGNEFDMLVDGVVRYSSYPFVLTVKVEGTAVSTTEMKKGMGEAKFNQWLKEHRISYDKNAEVADSDE